MNEFNANMINEENAKDAVETAVGIVKDVAVKSGSGITSRMGIAVGITTTVIGLVVGGVMFWRKHKAEKEEMRMPDAETPVELSDEDLKEITTAE